MKNVNIMPKTEVTQELMKRAKKRHRRNQWLGLLLAIAVGFVFAATFVGAVNEYYDGTTAYAATKKNTVTMHHGGPKYRDPVRQRKAVIIKAQKVRGIDTDCINAQQMKCVTLNTAVDTDGQIWKFYTTYGSKAKYRTFKYEVVTLWIFNNHTKSKLDDEVIGVGGECVVR